jgi:2-amino-4-hydroxy-6-hydroxymethyldihydropteridine diphosphokinase
MSVFLIGMGSNIEPERHLRQAAREIRARFPGARFSRVYRSPAVGMEGAADFLNACCLLESELDVDELAAWLKRLEDAHGRDRSRGSWRPRTLDLDVLMADDAVVDDELFRFAHAWKPASELADLPPAGVDVSVLEAVEMTLADDGD